MCTIFPLIMAPPPDALTSKGLSSDIGIGIATTFFWLQYHEKYQTAAIIIKGMGTRIA